MKLAVLLEDDGKVDYSVECLVGVLLRGVLHLVLLFTITSGVALHTLHTVKEPFFLKLVVIFKKAEVRFGLPKLNAHSNPFTLISSSIILFCFELSMKTL